MATRLSRAWGVRVAVTCAVLAIPLFAVGTAQASIAGANPATSVNYPVPRNATILDSTDAQVCFDKALSPSSDVFGDNFEMHLIGYNSANNRIFPVSVTLDGANNACADLAFSSHGGQLMMGNGSAVWINEGAVQAAMSGGGFNNADSVTLSCVPSTAIPCSQSGTVGHATGPDLVGPTVLPSSTSPNSIMYTFDENVDTTKALTPSDFWYENAEGGFCYADALVSRSGANVIVHFPTTNSAGHCQDTISGLLNPSVTNARRAGVFDGAVWNVADPISEEVSNTESGTNVPGAANNGATSIASLVSATLGPGAGQITYNFDKPLDGSKNHAGNFFVKTADGNFHDGSTVTGGSNPNQVVVTFSGLQFYDEYGIRAGVFNNATESSPNVTGTDGTTTYTNTPGDTPIGGNSGAFSRGFTTGADVFSVTFNTTTNVVTANLDQRIDGTEWTGPSDTTHIAFLNSNGDIVGYPSTVNIPSFPNPGPVAITMDTTAGVMALHPTQVAFDPFAGSFPSTGSACSFFTFLPGAGFNECSVPQTVKQVGVAAHIKSVKVAKPHHKAHKAHKARKAHKH